MADPIGDAARWVDERIAEPIRHGVATAAKWTGENVAEPIDDAVRRAAKLTEHISGPINDVADAVEELTGDDEPSSEPRF